MKNEPVIRSAEALVHAFNVDLVLEVLQDSEADPALITALTWLRNRLRLVAGRTVEVSTAGELLAGRLEP